MFRSLARLRAVLFWRDKQGRRSPRVAGVGHKGETIKKIGTEARKELEAILSARIYLGLYVKVAPDWRDKPQKVRELDWRFQLEELGKADDQDK